MFSGNIAIHCLRVRLAHGIVIYLNILVIFHLYLDSENKSHGQEKYNNTINFRNYNLTDITYLLRCFSLCIKSVAIFATRHELHRNMDNR